MYMKFWKEAISSYTDLFNHMSVLTSTSQVHTVPDTRSQHQIAGAKGVSKKIPRRLVTSV